MSHVKWENKTFSPPLCKGGRDTTKESVVYVFDPGLKNICWIVAIAVYYSYSVWLNLENFFLYTLKFWELISNGWNNKNWNQCDLLPVVVNGLQE